MVVSSIGLSILVGSKGDECLALQHFSHGFAQVGSHDIVHRRYQAIDHYNNLLADLIGKEEATNILVDIYNRIVK